MTWLLNLLGSGVLKLFGNSILKPILDTLNKKTDADLEKYKADVGATKDVSIELVRGEMARVQALKEVQIVGMSHPIWWLAWSLFVLPVGYYHFMIHLVSIHPDLFPVGYVVKRVPPMQEEWDIVIMQSIFFAQAGTGVINNVMNRFLKKR